MLKIILIAIPAIIVVFLIIVAMQPSSYRVTRSLAIAASPDALFPHMNDLKKWAAWKPYRKVDPSMKVTYCLSMDKMMGGKLEQALVELKGIAESPVNQ